MEDNLQSRALEPSHEPRLIERLTREAVEESESVCGMVVLVDANGFVSFSVHGADVRGHLHLLNQLDEIRAMALKQLKSRLQ